MNLCYPTQEASVSLAKRRGLDLRRFSMTSVRSPVSMALELATARKMRSRETVAFTLPAESLRVIGALLESIGKMHYSTQPRWASYRQFNELGYIEQWGSGIARIRTLCRQAGNPEPQFAETGGFLDREFHRTGSPNPDVQLGERLGEKLGETPQQILSALSANPRMAITQLAKELGISTTAVEKQIARLKQQGALERIGPAKGGHWKVKS